MKPVSLGGSAPPSLVSVGRNGGMLGVFIRQSEEKNALRGNFPPLLTIYTSPSELLLIYLVLWLIGLHLLLYCAIFFEYFLDQNLILDSNE